MTYYFSKYFYLAFTIQPIHGTVQQRELLQFKDGGKFCDRSWKSFLFITFITTDSSFITTSPSGPKPKTEASSVNVTTLSWHSSMNDSNRNLTSSCWSINQLSPQRSMNNSFGNNTSWQSIRGNTSIQNVSGGNFNSQPNSPPSFSSPYKYNNDRGEIIADEKDMQQYLKSVLVEGTPKYRTELIRCFQEN